MNYFNEPFLVNPAGKFKLGYKKNPIGSLLLWNPAKKLKHRLNVTGKKGNLHASLKSKLATPGIKINPVKKKKIKRVVVAKTHKKIIKVKGVKHMKKRKSFHVGFARPSFLSKGFSHRKVSRRRRTHRNAFLKGVIPSGIMPTNIVGTIKDSLFVSAGFAGVKVIPNRFVPIEWRSGAKGYAVKGLLALGLSIAASKVVSKEAGKLVLLGGLVALETEALGQVLGTAGVTTVSENLALGAYVDNSNLQAYVTEKM